MSASATVKFKPRFITDEQGHKQGVLLSMEEFEAVLEVIEARNDAADFDTAVDASTGLRDLDDVVADLKRDGLL
jgi:hypothetical protein